MFEDKVGCWLLDNLNIYVYILSRFYSIMYRLLVRRFSKMVDVVVEIESGKLKGTIRENFKGGKFYGYLGIPYAKPPVGELRFKAPTPAEPWSGILDATKDGTQCSQRNFMSKSHEGSEDCLHLNVYTKNVPAKQPLKPVLVFIHGGAFIMGTNNSRYYSPSFLMTEDIVVVSIQYRVGILGFLKLNDTSLGVPGNAGLKDQVLALKWVQKNISSFGGDPNNVTIYGESAGAASVNNHILSPASKGLFHKAVMQSGSVLNTWPHLRTNALECMMKLLKPDCKSEIEIYDTLMKASVEDLIDAQNKISLEFADDRLRSFAPCLEKPNETEFLTRNPIDVILSGDYNKVPMIIGYNSNEGLISIIPAFKPGNPHSTEIEYDYFVPQQMNLPPESDSRRKICEKLKTVYSNERSGDKYLILGDCFFVAGIIGLAENLVQTCKEPIYFHVLNLCTSRNMFKNMIPNEEPGAAHGDDLGYFFDNELFPVKTPIRPGSMEEIAITRYMKLWSNFMKYGNPTPDPNEFGLTWEPITKETVNYLYVEEELHLKTNPDAERMKIWREIYKLNENTKNFML